MIFVQSEFLADVRAVEVESTTSIAKLRETLMNFVPAGIEAPAVELYAEDSDDEHALEKVAEIPHGLRIHLHRLKGIDVVVRYAGREVRRAFRPSATIRRIKHWAVHEFRISPSDAAELMLQVTGTDQRPDADIHIGALVKYPQKSLCLDLVPSTRVNG
jgi:hypothetical protein